jgi:surface antigen
MVVPTLSSGYCLNVGWRTHISREVSSSLPAVGVGMSSATSTSKLKLSNQNSLQTEITTESASLTPIGRTVQATGRLAGHVASMPRLIAHTGMIAMVGAVVLTGSTGHPARLNPLADQTGFGSTLDQAAAVDVAAKVATQTDLLVTADVNTNAKALNAQVNLATSDDGTLAKRDVVDTAGSANRGVLQYTVQSGDTLASVASNYNLTTDTVRWANNLADADVLKPGQSLTILPISGIQLKVAAGDTPQALADKYQSNADQIVAFNNAEVNGLQPGQSIIVPDGVMPEAAKPASSLVANTPAKSAAATSIKISSGGGSKANGYSYGYCTYYVATRRAVPSNWGNANTWYSNAQISGYRVGSTPMPGAIAWTGAGYYGHVAYVESVSGGMVTVSEMNYNGNWGRVTSRTVPASSFRYIY